MALPTPIPHPLSFFDAPGWLHDALEWVVGVDWPEGNEKAMRDLADEWHAAAQRLGPLLEEADQAALAAVAAFGGPEGREAEALLALWHKLGGGPESAMAVVSDFLPALGNLVDAGANEIEGVKLEFYIELALLLIELLTLIATAVLTFGGSLTAAGPVMLATRYAIQQILRRATKELLERAVKKSLRDKAKSRMASFGLHTFREALEEGLQELGSSGGVQAYQIGQGNRGGFDPSELATSFGLGTLGGAVANVTSIGGVKATTMSGRFGEKALRGVTGEMLAEISIGIVTGQGVTWTSLGMAASSAGFGSVLSDGQHLVDARLTSDFLLGKSDPSLPEFLQSSSAPQSTSPALPDFLQPAPPDGAPPLPEGSALLSSSLSPGDPTLLSGISLPSDGSAPFPASPLGLDCTAVLPGDPTTAPLSRDPAPATLSGDPISAPPPHHTDPSPRAHTPPPVSVSSSWEPPANVHSPRVASEPSAPLLSAANISALDTSPAGTTPAGPAAGAAQPPAVASLATPTVAAPTHAPPHQAPPAHTAPHYAPPSNTPLGNAPPVHAVPVQHPPASAAPAIPAFKAPDPVTAPNDLFVLHTWLLPADPTKAVAPAPAPATSGPIVAEDPEERRYYTETLRSDIHFALTMRLLRLVDDLAADWPERRQDLRENAIAALTQQDIESIAGELWQIANSDSLEPRVRLTNGGLLDATQTSQATGSDYPPPVETSRRYNEPGGYRHPLGLHQQDVELAMTRDANGRPHRFADLNGEWLRRINDGGPVADLSRAINCTDVVLSVLDTWLHGRPRVAAPRTVDKFTLDSQLRPIGGEPDGVHRIEASTGGRFESLPADRPGFARLEEVLKLHGHGSCAVLVQQWPNGDSHATTVHNQNGEIFYVDAQRPESPLIGGRPLGADRMQVLLLDPTATPIELGTGQAFLDIVPEGPPRAHANPVTDLDRMMRDPTPEELAALGVGNATAADLGLAEADLSAKQRAELPHVAVLHPRQLGFTQRSVSAATGDGVAETELESRLHAEGWRGGPVHAVLWGDGSLASLDHRRLRAALRANLDRVPVFVHAPSDPITTWGVRGEHLADDLRRLPGNSLVVGGDEGELIYPKGTVPTTCGEAALFRAADQRSLLPGHLFGTKQEPVTIEKPPGRPTPPTLPESVTTMLHQLRAEAESQADPIQADLESLGFPLHNLENRIKSFESLAGKGDRVNLARVDDILRFKLVLPDGPSYTTSLTSCFEALGERGYEIAEVRNFWKSGNRFYSVNAIIRAPHGQLFQLQFSSPTALRADDMTYELYEIVRQREELAARRIHALLGIAAVNEQLGLSTRIPVGLSDIYPPLDRRFPTWVAANRRVWSKYEAWLAENNRTFADVALEFGLTAAQLNDHGGGNEAASHGN